MKIGIQRDSGKVPLLGRFSLLKLDVLALEAARHGAVVQAANTGIAQDAGLRRVIAPESTICPVREMALKYI